MRRRIPVVPEGWLLLGPLLLVSAAALLIGWYAGTILFTALAALVAQLFRDRHRFAASSSVDIIAPADGAIALIAEGLHFGGTDWASRVAISSSPFDVHVIRAPIGGRIVACQTEGETNFVIIEATGLRVGVSHQPGILSRVFRLDRKIGDTVATGERIGQTGLSSRIDLLLPLGAAIRVQPKERVKVGLSVVAEVESDQ